MIGAMSTPTRAPSPALTASATAVLYGIPNCDTVKKARAWLTGQGIEYQFHDFKKQGVPAEQLPRWADAVGWEKLLNRQGTTWRKLDAETQATVHDAASAAQVMLAQPSVIKRPVVEWADASITVGFNEADWNEAAKRRSKP
ncbi:transcriptional regulator, Spx/MgsR family [Paracidovorax valerianellae]|uniref:Transcriptional regulator, Spx/MgsR family n=2 Tax=Paracidovorax valerianellae TaxID=187868 RepID=A0A1G6YJI9_9BURK|nr:transcriptional regulator, Spx/MgsR family [Paracidovorax valerianellae]